MIFQGEEWAASSPFLYFANHDDPEIARLVSAGRKKEFSAFGWNPNQIPDPEKRQTFEQSKLSWMEVNQGEHAEMLAWYRGLIHLRRSTPSLNDGEPGHTRVTCDEQDKWLTMERGIIQVYCNLGTSAHSFAVKPRGELVLASRTGLRVDDGALELPPDTVAVIRYSEN